jgi:hypothetical protein
MLSGLLKTGYTSELCRAQELKSNVPLLRSKAMKKILFNPLEMDDVLDDSAHLVNPHNLNVALLKH